MLLDTLKTLCALSGPSSYEDPVRNYLKTRARKAGAECRVDAIGNLICLKHGAKPAPDQLMLAAHMDEVGLIVKRITENGFLKFGCIGGIDRRVLLGKPVLVGQNQIPGVIGIKPVHLTTEDEQEKIPLLTDLYLDIGAKSREEAESLTHLGDFAVFSSETVEFGQGMLKAKAIDDRIGCAVMMELLERDLPMDCTFVFTAQEEVGARGAFGAAFSVFPKLALILEGTTAADSPANAPHRRVCVPGRGPVLSYMDNGTIYHRETFELLRNLAEAHHIPWQTKEYIAGGTDAKAIQRTKTGIRVAAMSVATRYLHSPSSVASVEDCQNMERLAWLFIQELSTTILK